MELDGKLLTRRPMFSPFWAIFGLVMSLTFDLWPFDLLFLHICSKCTKIAKFGVKFPQTGILCLQTHALKDTRTVVPNLGGTTYTVTEIQNDCIFGY